MDINKLNDQDLKINWPFISYKILYEEGDSLHISEIIRLALVKDLVPQDINVEIEQMVLESILFHLTKNRNRKSPFRRVERNVYVLKTLEDGLDILSGQKSLLLPDYTEVANISREKGEPVLTLIKALGMYWERHKVLWKTEPLLWGIRKGSSKPTDFNSQRGIYILYDKRSPVYVGRVIDRSMGQRLFEHTYDRLAGRWDRFSWFGLLEVGSGGELIDKVPETITNELLISTFESLLIEAMEPPQNRRRGDDFSDIEFVQV
jgi:hypothetical protein